ncbi:DUF2249 domain-containing protein [Niveibacterium sp.]|uniref:DUF2249 domain-containing protein n=1 Tax=Niveibacterium sp. TaxID=2017444 RepID=UPI0035B0E6C1
MNAPRIVDARGLEPPQPLHLILEALDTLPRGEEAVLLLYREPVPLYGILKQNGFTHRTEFGEDGTVSIHIRHA